MAAQQTLTLLAGVRIPHPLPKVKAVDLSEELKTAHYMVSWQSLVDCNSLLNCRCFGIRRFESYTHRHILR